MKTVAIVGTSPSTRDLAPYQNKGIDIWMFNSQALADWAHRCDLIIEMHKPETFMAVPTSYTQWLAQTKTPIIMQEAHPAIPASRAFPLDEIMGKYGMGFQRGHQAGPIEYFTSSVCYAIALAIHEGYERIELYGVDMANNTEYIYQRDGIGLWFGIALGLGIEVYLPRECAMFNAPRYGYDDKDAVLDREEFERMGSELQPMVEEAHGNLKKAEGIVDAIIIELEANKRRNDVTPETIAATGDRYSLAMNELQQCIADYAALAAQYRLVRQLQMKVEKQMEAAGKAQEVNALRHEWKAL